VGLVKKFGIRVPAQNKGLKVRAPSPKNGGKKSEEKGSPRKKAKDHG